MLFPLQSELADAGTIAEAIFLRNQHPAVSWPNPGGETKFG